MKLDGITVIDLSRFLPGPALTQVMADHGAAVVSVENVDGGEPNREIGAKRDRVSVFFANTHRGKKSLTLNLKTEEGREILYKLVKGADIFGQNFRPGAADKNGFGYADLKRINPKLVYVSISGYGP